MDSNDPQIKQIEKRCFTLCKRIDASWRDAYVRDVKRDYAGQLFPDTQLDSSFTFTPTNMDDDWTVEIIRKIEASERPMHALCISLDTLSWSSKSSTYYMKTTRVQPYARTKRQMDYKYVKNGDDLLDKIARSCMEYANELRHSAYIFRLDDHVDLFFQITGTYTQKNLNDATLVMSDPNIPMQDLEGKEICAILQQKINDLKPKMPVVVNVFMHRTLAQFVAATHLTHRTMAACDVRECSNIVFRAKGHIDDDCLTAVLNSNFGTFGSDKSKLDNFYIRRLVDFENDFFPKGVFKRDCHLAHYMTSPEHMIWTFNEFLRLNHTLYDLSTDRDVRTRNFMDVMTFALGDFNHMTLKFCLDSLKKEKREKVRLYARTLLERGAGIIAAMLVAFLYDVYLYQRHLAEEDTHPIGNAAGTEPNCIEIRIAMRGYMRIACEPLNVLIRKYLYRMSDVFWAKKMPAGKEYIRPKFQFCYYKNTKTPGMIKAEALRRQRFDCVKRPLRTGFDLKMLNEEVYDRELLRKRRLDRAKAIAQGANPEDLPEIPKTTFVIMPATDENGNLLDFRSVDFSKSFPKKMEDDYPE